MEPEPEGYETRLCRQGLAVKGTVVLVTAGKNPCRNRQHPACKTMAPLLESAGTGAALFATPAEPYASALNYLARTAPGGIIRPKDSETRMFLHDLPVAGNLETGCLEKALENRKCAVIAEHGIAARGNEPAEAFVNFSAACFAGFVKFFSDTLKQSRKGRIDRDRSNAFSSACRHLPPPPAFGGGLAEGPFETPEQAEKAIIQAGKQIVERGLVNACFGNISYRLGDLLYISAAGSFLDQLEGRVVTVDMNTGSCSGARPSSELPAHMKIAALTGFSATIHGHPLFSVIMSMDCLEENCTHQGSCHLDCPAVRKISSIPIVPGETGSGPFGLDRTVPPAINRARAAIVYGHGAFASASGDFNNALGKMTSAEQMCRRTFFKRISTRTGGYK